MNSTPVTRYVLWSTDDHFVFMASKGFWDVVSEQEVARQAEESFGANESGDHVLEALVEKAVKAWRKTDPDSFVPDITALLLMGQ